MRIWVQAIRDYSFCPELWRLNKENGAYQPRSYNDRETDLLLKACRDNAEKLEEVDAELPPAPKNRLPMRIRFGKPTKVIVAILFYSLFLKFFIFWAIDLDGAEFVLFILFLILLFPSIIIWMGPLSFWFVDRVMTPCLNWLVDNTYYKYYFVRAKKKWYREVEKWYERRFQIYIQIISDIIRLIQSGRCPLSRIISIGDRNVELIADEFDLEVAPEELEVEINRFLKERGVDVLKTHKGEYIIQLAGETPSHLNMPSIHITREQVNVNNIKYQTITVITKPKQPIPDYVPLGYGYDLVETYVKMLILRHHLNELAESIDAEIRYPNRTVNLKELPLLKQYLVQIIEKMIHEESDHLLVNPHRCRICPKRNDCSNAQEGLS